MSDKDYQAVKQYTIMATVCNVILFLLFCANANADMDMAVIHHTATKDVSIDVIRRYHVNTKGWKDVGYHYLIRKNGKVEKGRDLNKRGAHAKGRNDQVGIALTGYDTFTLNQVYALEKLLRSLSITSISRHHEACPGKGLDVEQIQKWIQ